MSFLNSKETKASLTLYLVGKAVQFCKMPTKVVDATHSSEVRLRSKQKDADILITLYAVVALGDLGIIVHIYFSDTCVLVLVLRRVPEVGAESVIMMGTGAKCSL